MQITDLGSWLGDQPAISLILIALGAVVLLYFGRSTAHALSDSIFLGLYRFFRIASASVASGEKKLQERNRVVLLEHGRETVEREIEREFRRVHTIVERDLSGYPMLQREITEQISSIEEDYKLSEAVPPPGPDWIHAIEAVAKLTKKPNGETISAKVLEQIHKASVQQHGEILDAYREQVRERHLKLDGIKAYWRKLTNTIDEVGTVVQSLLDRSRDIDMRMKQYEEIVAATDQAERTLKASSLTQFLISIIVVGIAVGGAFINFHLIALPMSETVSSAGRVAGMPVSDVAGLFVILLEATFGLMLMESLRITRLFPTIAALDDKVLKRMAIMFFVFLLAFAFVEAALAFMRDQIAADNAALRHSLTGTVIAVEDTPINAWIPMAGQMIMGFVLPFALAFVAIPLESLLHSGRTTVGHLLGLAMRMLSTALRMMAMLSRQAGKALNSFYDLTVIPLIWAEDIFAKRPKKTVDNEYDQDSTLVERSSVANQY
ncbi:MAG: hypothetical protein ABGY96_17270 [bacterium]|nr:hypothetical protein [Gammaproteobacteria bacterium]